LTQNDQEKRWDSGVQTTARTTNAIALGLKPGLKPGAYVVMWQNLGADGHRVRGSILLSMRHKDSDVCAKRTALLSVFSPGFAMLGG
jgi:methionine-rich copper-binding protein CopC